MQKKKQLNYYSVLNFAIKATNELIVNRKGWI